MFKLKNKNVDILKPVKLTKFLGSVCMGINPLLSFLFFIFLIIVYELLGLELVVHNILVLCHFFSILKFIGISCHWVLFVLTLMVT